MLTQALLKERLRYSPETGEFAWVGKPVNKVRRAVAGSIGPRGYIRIYVAGKIYMAHRLAFLYMEGVFPPAEVDHVDGLTGNNVWSNLRHATRAQNTHNTKIQCNSGTGFKNVMRCTTNKNYSVDMRANGKRYGVHGFRTPELASEFAGLMREVLHGAYARHG